MTDLLAEVSLDAFLAARYCTGEGVPEGRAWERAASTLLQRPGLTRQQAAGLTTLFGMPSLSGARHELDGAAGGWRGRLLLECKALTAGVSKSDVATFELKTFDYYVGQLDVASRDTWWRMLVSATPAPDSVRVLCFRLGIVLCDPNRFPLPILLRAASMPVADQVMPEVKLKELVRLGEESCQPMQARWRIFEREIRFTPRRWSKQDTEDLLWLQDELTADLFDVYDQWAPGRLEERAARLRRQIEARERAVL